MVQGDCTSISVLNNANVTDADLFIGVTASEAVNLTACYLAKQLGAKKTIARISNPELKENENIDFSDLGISELISPEILTSKEINMAINRAEFTDPFEFDDGALITLGLSATHTSTFVGKTWDIFTFYNLAIIFLDVVKIAKLASAFKVLIFIFNELWNHGNFVD